jgi:hypothetical protein
MKKRPQLQVVSLSLKAANAFVELNVGAIDMIRAILLSISFITCRLRIWSESEPSTTDASMAPSESLPTEHGFYSPD